MSEEEKIKEIIKKRNLIIKNIIIIGIIISILLLITIIYLLNHECTELSVYYKTMSEEEKISYNSEIEKYIEDKIKGEKVKELIEKIIDKNNQNTEKTGKFISIYIENIKEYQDKEKLIDINKKANIFENNEGNNNQENVKQASKEYKKIKEKISEKKQYKVKAEYMDGIIYKIIISE